jgi:hypothetical protein
VMLFPPFYRPSPLSLGHVLLSQPLTLAEYRKLDLKELPLKEQRRYWRLLNRQIIKEKNATGQQL